MLIELVSQPPKRIILLPGGAPGWHSIEIGDYKVGVNGFDGINPDIVWYNLGFKRDRGMSDSKVIKFFIKNQIPFEFLPNGSFPRIQMKSQYFELLKPLP